MVEAQDDDQEILERVRLFRAVALADSTTPTPGPVHDLTKRFLHVDSIVLAADTARVHLTLRHHEHAHRESYVLIRHGIVWNVIELKIDRILRLYGPLRLESGSSAVPLPSAPRLISEVRSTADNNRFEPGGLRRLGRRVKDRLACAGGPADTSLRGRGSLTLTTAPAGHVSKLER